MNKKTIFLVISLIIVLIVGALSSRFYLKTKPLKECEVMGGVWMSKAQGPFQQISGAPVEYFCNFRTSDAGKECIDSSECEGSYIANPSEEERKKIFEQGFIYTKGYCSEWRIERAYCPYIVREGKVELI